jgi:hypothetical protein
MTLKICLAGLGASLACSAVFAGPLLSETFDDITTLAASGWVLTNNSTPPGTPWFQGNSAIFPAASGAPNSYIAANYTSAEQGGIVSNISNWLITPQMALANGETLNFALRLFGEGYLDTVEVYLSTNGASANVGSTDTSIGDFGLLQSFASTSDTGWMMKSLTLSGLGAPVSGRFAFRYTARSNDGDYVGIDSVLVSAQAVPEPGTLALATLGLGALAWRRRSRGAKLPSVDPVAIS